MHPRFYSTMKFHITLLHLLVWNRQKRVGVTVIAKLCRSYQLNGAGMLSQMQSLVVMFDAQGLDMKTLVSR